MEQISDQTFLGKFLRFPFKFVPKNSIIRILYGALRGKKWIVGSSVHGCWFGTYEYKKQSLFTRSVAKGSIVFDIGAHVGFYTLLSSILVGLEGKVFAFEPVPANLFFLKRHLELNNISNVSIIEAAVSNRGGFTYFEESDKRSTGHISTKGRLMVRTVSLDELYRKKEVVIPEYLKIDVEGAEMMVLEGAKFIISESSPVIFLATHGERRHQECVKFLKSMNYRIEPIDNKKLSHSEEIIAYK